MPGKPQAILTRTIRSIAATFAVLGVTMFLPTGDIRWAKGWVFLLVLSVLMVVAIVYLWRTNPAIFIARSRIQPGTKRWDRVLVVFLLFAIVAIFPVAALDDGRFRWSHVPLGLVGLGYALLIAGFFITIWVERVNKFAELGVRIQEEHRVIDTGPYGIVRHPMYLGAVLMFVGIPLALGSYWALIATTVVIAILLLRTVLEDKTLHTELVGYRDYAERVRFRLIPRIW